MDKYCILDSILKVIKRFKIAQCMWMVMTSQWLFLSIFRNIHNYCTLMWLFWNCLLPWYLCSLKYSLSQILTFPRYHTTFPWCWNYVLLLTYAHDQGYSQLLTYAVHASSGRPLQIVLNLSHGKKDITCWSKYDHVVVKDLWYSRMPRQSG